MHIQRCMNAPGTQLSMANKPGRHHQITMTLGVLFILLSLYVLSLGPLVWLSRAGILSRKTCDALEPFYAPLQSLGNRCKPFNTFMDWYVTLWEPAKK